MKLFPFVFSLLSTMPLTSAKLYTVMFLPPGTIKTFMAYLTVPPLTQDPNAPNATLKMYTALQPGNAVALQLPVSNRQGGGGSWWLQPTWCCDTNNNEYVAPGLLHAEQQVYPGMTVSNDFDQDSNGNTAVKWGGVTQVDLKILPMANLSFNSATHTVVGSFDKAIFTVDIAENANWDFGEVVWKNIQIVVTTASTNTAWCDGRIDGPIHPIWNEIGGNITKATATLQNGQQTCNIDMVVLSLPALAT